jgi:formate dehydrogenase (coenzyme F420) beta subunit
VVLKGMPEIVKPAADPYAAVTAHAARPEKERWEKFKTEMAKCIRCYACRQACPVCFCERCFAERNDPPWVGLTDDPTDTAIFQMTRFLHVSGRCVDCGACERACPAGVDLGLFRLKIEKDIRDMYGHEAGMDPAAPGAMTSYKTDDTEDFMLHI